MDTDKIDLLTETENKRRLLMRVLGVWDNVGFEWWEKHNACVYKQPQDLSN